MTGDRVAALWDAFAAVPPQLNPHAAAASRHLDRWVVEHRLIGRSVARERFDRADFGWFAAITYPTANESDLALVADWFAWLFLLDDQLDDGLLGRDTDRTGELMGAIFNVLDGLGARPGAPSIVTSLDDLWRRTVPTTSPAWRRRFVGHVVAGGVAASWEANNRVRGTIPDEESYVENRRHTGAIYVCMDLIEIVEHLDVAAEVYDSAPFARVLDAACDVVCWTNDLYSLDKETSLGEYHNLVTVTQHARGLSQAEAIQVVAGRIIERLREYLAWEPEALASGPHWSVAPYLAGMRSWMRGNLDWSASTRRYRDALRDNGSPAEYLEAVLVDRGAV
jgi:hypothetical protein